MAKQKLTPPTLNSAGPAQVVSHAELVKTGYKIVGLLVADRMPIQFAGHEYDLANLSAEEADHLLQYPEQVPYLKSLNVSQTNV